MAKATETLVRLCCVRNIYLRSIKNSERDILEMIEKLFKDDENSATKLASGKFFLKKAEWTK